VRIEKVLIGLNTHGVDRISQFALRRTQFINSESNHLLTMLLEVNDRLPYPCEFEPIGATSYWRRVEKTLKGGELRFTNLAPGASRRPARAAFPQRRRRRDSPSIS
jgi:hypothetical protein